ncbi:MAG: glycosyltransferase [Candidatus Acidifodinimicrobium sp.]
MTKTKKHDEYVVIPTFKEADNLKILLPLLRRYKVVIVDDNSNDGTVQVCRRFKNVRLIVRAGKMGLATAVMDGINSIKDRDAKIVVTDADFEHDYSRIPDFFRMLDDYDFVEGVKVGDRIFGRGFISNSGRYILRMMVPETAWLRDPMSGFFGFRLDKVDLSSVKPIGYKIMLDIFMNLKKGSRKAHLEYRYGRRERGRSKLSLKVMLEFLIQVARLNKMRFLIFLTIGVAGIFINEGLLYIFYQFMSLFLALVLAIVISTVINFLLNHYITFKARANMLYALIKFSIITAAGGLINLFIAFYLSYVIMYLVANFIGICAAFIFKYFFSENFIWKTES